MSGHSSFSMKSVVQQYRKFIVKNQDLGSSFAIYNGSVRIVDLIGGYEDLEFEQIWSRNTISQLFSVSNVVGILSLAHLVNRGLLKYDDQISQYLPYCHSAIANITISDVLMHKSKIPYFSKSVSITDYRDEPEILFKQFFSHPPSVSNHQILHKYTLGIVIDALVRKVDPASRTVAEYFTKEISYRHQIDLLTGLPRTQMYRTTRIYNPSFRHYLYALGRFDFNLLFKSIFSVSDTVNKIETTFSDLKDTKTKNPEHLEIPLVSWNVFSNAYSLAKLFSVLFFGSPSSPAVFNQSTIRELCDIQTHYYDEVLSSEVTFSKGGLMIFSGPKNSQLYGWRDSSGQFIWMDLERNITIAYVTNHLRALSYGRDFIHSFLLDTIYSVL